MVGPVADVLDEGRGEPEAEGGGSDGVALHVAEVGHCGESRSLCGIRDELVPRRQDRAFAELEDRRGIDAGQGLDGWAVDVVLAHSPDHVDARQVVVQGASGAEVEQALGPILSGERCQQAKQRTRSSQLADTRDEDGQLGAELRGLARHGHHHQRPVCSQLTSKLHAEDATESDASAGRSLVCCEMTEMLPISEALAHNVEYGARHGATHLPTEPRRRLAIVTCMDSRLDLFGALGLDLGEAHIIRNAGGVATDDVIRSLILSQRTLGTERIMLIHHTRCGLHGLDKDELRQEISKDTGLETTLRFGAFADTAENVRATARRLNAEPALRHVELRGFIFDVDSGFLEEIELDES